MDEGNESTGLYEEARSRMAAGQHHEAVSLFQQSASLDPHFKTLELLGECHLKLERFSEAVIPLAAATALNKQVRAPALLAQAFFRLGDRPSAREFAKLALSREPNNRKAQGVLLATEDLGQGQD